MEYRYLGNSGLRVSTIILGSMNFGATTNETTARRILDTALGQGVNFIDTADAYVGGASEAILGKLIKKKPYRLGRRDQGRPTGRPSGTETWALQKLDDGSNQ
jgi:aryl-alcohol dehydrogenase-like predicted oxidoreductase